MLMRAAAMLFTLCHAMPRTPSPIDDDYAATCAIANSHTVAAAMLLLITPLYVRRYIAPRYADH